MLHQIVEANTKPTNPGVGEMYFDEETKTLRIWSGEVWIILAPVDVAEDISQSKKEEQLKRFRKIMEEE